MLTAKIVSIVLTLLAALAQYALDYKWKDRRTRAFSRARVGLLSIYTIGAMVSMILVVIDDEQSSRLVGGLVEIRDSLSTQANKSAQREQAAISSNDRVQSELINLKNSLSAFQQLASKRFPLDPPDIALSKLVSEVSSLQKRTSQLEHSTAEIASRDLFRPASDALKNQVVASLKATRARFAARIPEITIFCETGSRSRQLLAQELDDILKAAGFPSKGISSGTTFASGALPPIQMNLHDDDLEVAQALAAALHPVVTTQFSGVKNSKNTKGTISISVFGTPIFSSDGSVELR